MTSPPSEFLSSDDAGLQLTLALDKIRDSFDEDDDPHAMFNAITHLLRERFNASACALVLLAETSDDIEAIACSGLSQGEALDLCREAMHRDSLATLENPYWRFTIGNRITMKNLPLGGLAIARQESPFSPYELKLMEIAEKQIDSAILQARMIWKLAQRNRELTAIYKVDRLRDQITDENKLIAQFTEILVEEFQADFAIFCEQQGDEILVRSLLDKRGLSPDAIQEFCAAALDLEVPQVITGPLGQRSPIVLAAPFIVNHKRIGAVIIGRDSLFTVGDHRLLYALTSQMDSAMFHTKLLHQGYQVDNGSIPAFPQLTNIERAPLNDTFRYVQGTLYCDEVAVKDIVATSGTPTYLYSLRRVIDNFARIKSAFPKAHIHFSAKANNHNPILQTLIHAGAGIDTVSAGEIFLAERAGARPENIVFAGVGKVIGELYYAVSRGIGWFNVENIEEVHALNAVAQQLNTPVRVALRYNPEVSASTHPHIATGHSAAKFGLSAMSIRKLLEEREAQPYLNFEGIHIHIGSQLGDTSATRQAIQNMLELAAPYPFMQWLNLGGGFPTAYKAGENLPTFQDFADTILPLTRNYHLILEPGRSLVADAGILLTRVQYVKRQAGKAYVILDAGMTELIRPMLYQTEHIIIPVSPRDGALESVTLVGPVCESTDVLAKDVLLPPLEMGDSLAVLTAGAYGMVMSSNYNARLRPAEAIVLPNGTDWRISRRRETWEDLIRCEVS